MRLICHIASAAVWAVMPALAATWTVPTDLPTIQGALEAGTPGDTVLVLPGTYVETLDFMGKDLVLRGSDPDDWNVVEATVVDGSGQGSVVTFAAGESRAAVLEGLTLTGGSGTLYHRGAFGGESYVGGGIYCAGGAAPTIRTCLVRDNAVLEGERARGGGIFAMEEAAPLFSRLRVENNQAFNCGGGIYAELASIQVSDCVITGNEVVLFGGGIGLIEAAAEVLRSDLLGNVSSTGGGLYMTGDRPVRIAACKVMGNYADGWGGGARISWTSNGGVQFYNTIISGNQAGGRSGALDADDRSVIELHNSTICNNEAGAEGAFYVAQGTHMTLTNCIVWNNGEDPIYLYTHYPYPVFTVRYCDIEGGWEGEGNIDQDPLFYAREIGGFPNILQSTSPCIDRGAPWLEDSFHSGTPGWPAWYQDGKRSDMGAYGGPGNRLWVKDPAAE